MSKKFIPKVPIEQMTFEDSVFVGSNKAWKAQTLIDYCKAKGYKEFDMPLACVNLTKMQFQCDRIDTFIFQVKRVHNCDLKYPIILDSSGQIADGWHRVCKAILEGKETIKAIRMEDMPSYDYLTDDDNK